MDGNEIVFKHGDGDVDNTYIYGAAFSPDGRHVVTASEDRTARIWDVETGSILAVLRGHKDQVVSAVFSSDNRRVVTASRDGIAIVWPHYQTDDDLFQHAQEIVEKLEPLTEKEKCDYYMKTEGCASNL